MPSASPARFAASLRDMAKPAELVRDAEEKLDREEYDAALKVASEALALSRKARDSALAAKALRIVVSAHIAKGSLSVALETAQDEAGKFEKAGDKNGQAFMLIAVAEAKLAKSANEGAQDSKQQLFGEALRVASDARDLLAQTKDKPGEIQALHVIADVNLLAGNFDDASNASEKALSIAEGLGDKKLGADSNAAVTRTQFGAQNRGKAWRSALKTAEMYRELGDKVGEAMTLNIIAQIHMENFRLHEALRTAEQGLSLAREGGSVKCTDTLLDIVVNAHAERGDVMEAQALARDQLAAVEGKPGEAAAWMRAVKTYRATGDVPGALKLAKDSLKRLMSIGSEVLEAEMNLILARLYFEDQNSEAALMSAQQAVKLYKKLDSQKGEDSARQLISDVRVARGEKPPPSRERTESLALLKELVKAFEDRDMQAWEQAAAKLNKARCITQDDIDDALTAAFMLDPHAAKSFLEDFAESTGAPPDFVKESLMIELKDKVEPVVEKGPQSRALEQPKQMCYGFTRYGGMGFGPRFRTDQLLFAQRDSQSHLGIACVPRLQMSGCESWEEKVYFHPGLVDCPIHSTGAMQLV